MRCWKQEGRQRKRARVRLAACMLTEPSCSACWRVGRSRVAHQTSAMRHLCVVLTLHWLRAKYTAFILRICTCPGGSSCCTRPNTWLRNRSASPRTWDQKWQSEWTVSEAVGIRPCGCSPPEAPGSAAAAAATPHAGLPLAPRKGRRDSGSWWGDGV